MAELKPCPFCGGEPFFASRLPFYGEGYQVAVVCEGCNAQSKYIRTKEEAIEAWNRRTTEKGGAE